MTHPQQPNWPDPTGQPGSQATPNPVEPTTGPADPYQYAQQYTAQPYSPPLYGQQPVYVARPTNGMAIASLVCSLAGILTLISAPVGAILGHVARKQIRETGEQGEGMAVAGIWVGWIVTALYVCGCGVYIAVVAAIIGSGAAST